MAIVFNNLITDWSGASPATSGSFTPVGNAIIVCAFDGATNNATTFSGSLSTWTSFATRSGPRYNVGGSVPVTAGAQTCTATATTGQFHVFGIDYSGVQSATASIPVLNTTPGTGVGAILGVSVTVPTGSVLIAHIIDTSGNSAATLNSPSGTSRGGGSSQDGNFNFAWTEYAGAGANIQPSFTDNVAGATHSYVVGQALLSPIVVVVPPPNPIQGPMPKCVYILP